MKHTEYDIIIIGSGLGGLLSAVMLAKEGKKVCVLEKNNQYGGNLQTFVRDKIIFDTGVHYVGSLDKDQILYKYFDYAGIAEHLELEKLDTDGYDRICFGDAPQTEYPHAQGYDNFTERLLSYFPEQEEALRQYAMMMQQVCDGFPLYRFRPDGSYNMENLTLKTSDFIQQITDDTTLQAVLLGSNFLYAGTSPQTPFYVHALSVNSYIESAYRFKRGGSQLTNLLVKVLRSLGGELYKHSEVVQCSFQDKNLHSVITKDGKEYVGKTFISNIDVKTTLDLVGSERFKSAYYNRIKRLKPVSAAFSLHLVMKPDSFPYLPYNIYWFQDTKNVWNAHHYTSEEFPLSYMLSMNPPKGNPQYADNMTVLTYMNYEDLKAWEHTFNTKTHEADRGQAYQNFKNHHTEKLLKAVEKKFPDLRQHIDKIYTSSPLTYRDYIGIEAGSCYGYEKEADNPMASFIVPQTHVPNLFLTGQTVNMHGLLGVTIGAVRTCIAIMGQNSLLYQTLLRENETKK